MKPLKIVSLLILAAVLSSSPLHADTLTFSPQHQTVNLGDQAVVDVMFDTPYVGDFDMIVNWDDSILDLASVVFGTQLGNVSDPDEVLFYGADDLDSSSVNVYEVSFLDVAALMALQGNGPITFFSLTFNTLDVGTSLLEFTSPNQSYLPIGNEFGAQRNFSVEDGSITVIASNNVPVPGTWLLLGAGMLALMLQRRRQGLTS
jgi:hypothetical protein